MSQKGIIMTGMTVGSILGGYLPTLWGVSVFSWWSILTTAIGGLLGIYIAYKLTQY